VGCADFFVLLGPDSAGKSSAMREISATTPSLRLVSTDTSFVGAEHELIARLRRSVVDDVLPGLGEAWSPEFLACLLQTAVVHLRDQLMACDGSAPVLVDSYYYKILAKCRLAGVADSPMYAWWRSFPQPEKVIYLDVPPETAWRRCGFGASLNPLEYCGDGPERSGFEQYQKNLRTLMWEEVGHLPVTVIDEQSSAAGAAAAVLKVLAS
jgi:thymidylate kinase